MNWLKMIKKLIKRWQRLVLTPENYARSIGVKIGKGCLISSKGFPSEAYLIEIGNYARVASNVKFFTHGGVWSQRIKTPDIDYFGKIKVGNYTYIGDGAYLMAGVVVGNDVIIGSGSIVTKSIPDGCIVAGNPAKIIGRTNDFVKKIKGISLPTKKMNPEEKQSYLLSLSNEKFIKKPFMK